MNKIMIGALAGIATMVVGVSSAWAADGDRAEPVSAPPCDEDTPCFDEGETCIYNNCYVPESCETAADCWTGYCGADGICAEPPSCSADADCEEGTVCYGSRCQPADLFCDVDADCGEGEICDYGMCEDRGRTCLSDGDCGELAHCVFDGSTTVETGTASATSTDPASASGGASNGSGAADDGAGADEDSSPVPDGQSEEAPMGTYVERGECRIDVEAVTESADCRAMCEAAAACAMTGGGAVPEPATPRTDSAEPQSGDGSSDSSDAAPACGDATPGGPDAGCMVPDDENQDDTAGDASYQQEMIALFIDQCTLACSYGVAIETDYAGDVSAASACLASLESCDEMETACEPEFNAIEEMMDAVGNRVDIDMGYSSAGSGATTSGVDAPRVSGDGNTQELSGSPAPDNSACSGGGGGAPVGLALLAALMLLVVRRRSA